MKTVAILIAFVLVCYTSQGQTTEEWFKQKKTQTKYLLQQIAALDGYIGYVNKGHSIAQEGLESIENMKDGEWKLHTGFINAKDVINPNIRNSTKIAVTIATQIKIGQAYQNSIQLIKTSNLFIDGEMDYLYQVFATLLQDCEGDIHELTIVISPGKWKMNDEERLQRINQLYMSIQDKYAFVQDFTHSIQILAVQRMKEKKEVHTSQAFNKLKSE